MAQKDYYKTLGVAESATQDDIKKAYKKLAIKYHPDKNMKNKEAAETRFKEISEAYYVLGNPQKRQEYDTMRKYGYSGPGAAGGASGFSGSAGFNFEELLRQFSSGGGQSRRTRRSSSPRGGDYSIFDDILGDMFGFSGGSSTGAGPQTRAYRQAPSSSGYGQQKISSDIEQTVRLKPEQIRAGGKIKLKLPDGEVLMVNIPKNATDGQKLKIPGRGAVCPCCDKKGDLLLVLRIS
jgi:molecular chaperone DnaJ